jgi:hypothetical protein
VRPHDVAGNRPGRCCPPRHRLPFNSIDEGSECVYMTRRGNTYQAQPPTAAAAAAGLEDRAVGAHYILITWQAIYAKP